MLPLLLIAYQWAIDIQGRNGPYPYIIALRNIGDESNSCFQTGCHAVSSSNLQICDEWRNLTNEKPRQKDQCWLSRITDWFSFFLDNRLINKQVTKIIVNRCAIITRYQGEKVDDLVSHMYIYYFYKTNNLVRNISLTCLFLHDAYHA